MKLTDLINTEVQIYPDATYSKHGVIVGVEQQGVFFKITKSSDPSWTVGEVRFIAFSANLNLAFADNRA